MTTIDKKGVTIHLPNATAEDITGFQKSLLSLIRYAAEAQTQSHDNDLGTKVYFAVWLLEELLPTKEQIRNYQSIKKTS